MNNFFNKILLKILHKLNCYFPNKTVYSIKEYLTENNLLTNYSTIHPSYNIEFNSASNVFAEYKNLQFPEIFYCNLGNCIVFKSFEFIATKSSKNLFIQSNPYNDFYYSPTLFDSYNASISKKHYLIKEKSTFIKVKNNYYHFYFDTLLRIIYYNQYLSPNVDLYIDKPFTAWQKEILELLNISNLNYKVIPEEHEYIDFKHLYFVSFSGLGAGIGDFNAINLLNSKLIEKLNKSNKQKKIYLSRAKASHRKVVNENELTQLLTEKYDFEIIYIEEIKSISQQYNLFFNASHIIAVHGASLTNLIITKDIYVIELLNEQHLVTSYSHISNCLNNKYFPVLCKNQGEGDIIGKEKSFVHNNIIVNIDAIDKVLCDL